MRRILHVVGDSKFGGGSSIVLRLAQEAANYGFEAEVLATDLTFVGVLKNAGIQTVGLDVIRRDILPWHDVAGLARLAQYLHKHRYDIVHTHTSKAGFVGRGAARLAGVPSIVHTAHGFAFHERSSPAKIRFYSALERLAARWCDQIVTVSQFHREWALKLGIAESSRISAIPNGLSLDRVKPAKPRNECRSVLRAAEDEVVVASIGRLAPEKGLEDLIECARLLRDSGTVRFRVVIAGEGQLLPSLRASIEREGLASVVQLLGFVSNVGDLLSASDVVAIPSLREGLSISLLEAMAAQKAIVASRIGSNLEVLEHGVSGLLVEPQSPSQLAQALRQLTGNTALREQLGKGAYSQYLSKYTEERMLAEYMDLYLDLTDRDRLNRFSTPHSPRAHRPGHS